MINVERFWAVVNLHYVFVKLEQMELAGEVIDSLHVA